MNHLVSVVIPAYNAAKRIKATLLSVAAQDYENIEIIVVDDASSDDTGAAANDVLGASGRAFKVITHDTNKGECAARNTGLRAAAGDYLIFFDADDLADPNFVSVLLGAITENNGDAAFCGFRDRFEATGKEREIFVSLHKSHKYSAEELTVMYIFRDIRPAIWTTIFKTSFLKTEGLEFTEGCWFGGDVEFLTKALSRCGSINFATGCHYIYIHHEDMISSTMRQTPEKSRRRYENIAGASCRAARYLAEHARSPKVRAIAKNLMLAEGLIKTMNAAAMRRDEAQFYRTLNDPETRRALKASIRYFARVARKPEVFLKAAALLVAPGLYYRLRSKGAV